MKQPVDVPPKPGNESVQTGGGKQNYLAHTRPWDAVRPGFLLMPVKWRKTPKKRPFLLGHCALGGGTDELGVLG